MHNPCVLHWAVVKRIQRHLKCSLHHGLRIHSSSDSTLNTFLDLYWVRCSDDQKLITGYLIFLGPNLISWCSKKQPTVVHSNTEAEYRSLVMASTELVWLKSLLHELSHTLTPILWWCDNLGVMFLASNPTFHACTKHKSSTIISLERKLQMVAFVCV
jgi:hypothetical protein